MKRIFFFLAAIIVIASCKLSNSNQHQKDNAELAALMDKYYDKRMELFPLEATVNGDNRFNHLLPADFTDSYRAKLKEFFSTHLAYLKSIDSETLNDNDKATYSIFKYEMEMGLDGLALNYMGSSALGDNSLIPFDQFNGVPLTLGQMGGGTGNQPFKTIKDYDNWLQRAAAFNAWADSAIVYFRKGMAANYVLPKTIVVKMIPQMEAMVVDDPKKSLFYTPISMLDKTQGGNEKGAMGQKYEQLISQNLVPAYKKLADFLKNEYLPKARATTGVNALPNGNKYYKYMVKYWTTTNKSPEEIYNTGLAEVKRIRDEMEKIKAEVKFNGNLKTFFEFMKTDKQFMPYKTPNEVLAAFRNIQKRIDPNLKKMYSQVPKTKFEIRQTEAFREASASAEYYPGLEGERAGIFYVPIVDATKFNTTSGMESLFLHEAIPGHYYQMSLQAENSKLPKFRKFIWYGAYGEGYALYCESLGKELGLYTDPYQYMGALGDEIHRAIRLVVDVAMHTGKMTREEAIQYMMDNEAISKEGATAEIERYMVYPGQALSYKTGALKIKELREKYTKQLGSQFKLDKFHDRLLGYGCMPLDLLEQQMDDWAKGQ